MQQGPGLVRDVDALVGGSMGYITCFLRDGDRVFLIYSTTGRGNEPVNGSLGLRPCVIMVLAFAGAGA